jgi:(1->4)-alpha-D-glucan 1-alpha-D-glucosylmutase
METVMSNASVSSLNELGEGTSDVVHDRGTSSRTTRRRMLPSATYRLQFNATFTFRDAQAIVPYLARLGISHCYASPFLKARVGSPHGYDIVDHSTFNPEIGTEAEFREFVTALHSHGMGLILDFVPNHMAVATSDNAWWMDVLEDGPSSPYASFFDIDWMPLKPDLAHKVLLPVLGDQFGKILEEGQLVLTLSHGTFSVCYFDRRFPIATRSTGLILRHRLDLLLASLGEDDPHLIEYQSILTAIGHLPGRTESHPQRIAEGRREKEVIRRRLNDLCEASSMIQSFLDENVRLFNGQVGDARSFDLLDQLLLDQAYRLAFWRVAADEINYRRFFDINELAAICMENPTVFEKTHRLVFQLMNDGLIDGLRIDHPDGLYDPLDYFTQIVTATSDGTPPHRPDPYLTVEKILGRGEPLPEEWPVHGTTGYDFLNASNRLFVDRSNTKECDAVYTRFIHDRVDFKPLVYRCKKLIMDASMSSEISVLGHELDRISEQNRRSRDFTLRGLTEAIREVIACFPVYRTYITAAGVPDRDRKYVEMAVARAKRMNPAVNESIFDFVREILLLQVEFQGAEQVRDAMQRFVSQFQQVTSPVMAKAVEDTAFYIYNRLVSLNEVGGDPEKFGITIAAFHQQNSDRLQHWPYSLLATSTHDSKRSEDVRARINVLSEIPREWRTQVFRWSRLNHRKKVEIDGGLAPSRNDEYLLYQTLVGTWPAELSSTEQIDEYVSRMQQYMLKASREAKVHTSWISPHAAYEQALTDFVSGILRDPGLVARFEPFARRIAEFGLWNSLSQTLLKLTCPGVPDIYQGTELLDYSLVDPDNRRPVDFNYRNQLLDELETLQTHGEMNLESVLELVDRRHSGLLKLWIVSSVLNHRRSHPEVYARGAYLPIVPAGSQHEHVCVFARVLEGECIIAVVPRLLTHLVPDEYHMPPCPEVWHDLLIELPPELRCQEFHNVLTGERIEPTGAQLRIAAVLQHLPLALLSSSLS